MGEEIRNLLQCSKLWKKMLLQKYYQQPKLVTKSGASADLWLVAKSQL
jgi:hypothetical protein